jgi:hypothetical protein
MLNSVARPFELAPTLPPDPTVTEYEPSGVTEMI